MRAHLDVRQVRLVNEVARASESRVVTTDRGDAIVGPASVVPPMPADGWGAVPGIRRRASHKSPPLPETDVRIETHWTRILHVDLFADHDALAPDEGPDAVARPPRHFGSTRGREDPAPSPGPHFRSPLVSALVLLGLYVVMAVTFAGFLQLLGTPGPSAPDASPPAIAADDAGSTR